METMTLEEVRALLIEKTVRNRRGTIACPAWAKCVRDAIDAAIKQREQDKRDAAHVCVWTEDEDGNWDTGCENLFVLNDGTPAENDMKFCCYCGNKLEQETLADAALAQKP